MLEIAKLCLNSLVYFKAGKIPVDISEMVVLIAYSCICDINVYDTRFECVLLCAVTNEHVLVNASKTRFLFLFSYKSELSAPTGKLLHQ